MSLCTLRYLLSCRPEVGTLPLACLGPRWLRAVLAHIGAGIDPERAAVAQAEVWEVAA